MFDSPLETAEELHLSPLRHISPSTANRMNNYCIHLLAVIQHEGPHTRYTNTHGSFLVHKGTQGSQQAVQHSAW